MEATQAREATRLNEILLAALQGNLKVLKEYEKTAGKKEYAKRCRDTDQSMFRPYNTWL